MENIIKILEIDKNEFQKLSTLNIIQQLINLDGDEYSDGEVIDLIQEVLDYERTS